MTPTPPDPAAEAVELSEAHNRALYQALDASQEHVAAPVPTPDLTGHPRAPESVQGCLYSALGNIELTATQDAPAQSAAWWIKEALAKLDTPEPTEAQVERVALVLLNDDRIAAGLPPVSSRDTIPDSDGYARNARAAIAAMAPGESCKETGPFLCTTPEAVKPLYTSEPDEAMVERVARAIAEAGHIDLSMAIGHAGGIVAAVRQADAFDDRDPRFRDWSIPQARGVVIYARAALTAAAMPAGEITYEVWQDDMMVAGADSEAHARHYLAVYGQDGPATLYRVETRRSALADLGGGK